MRVLRISEIGILVLLDCPSTLAERNGPKRHPSAGGALPLSMTISLEITLIVAFQVHFISRELLLLEPRIICLFNLFCLSIFTE